LPTTLANNEAQGMGLNRHVEVQLYVSTIRDYKMDGVRNDCLQRMRKDERAIG
jgi:hypothetical protein